jgi:hypothetical protein
VLPVSSSLHAPSAEAPTTATNTETNPKFNRPRFAM